MELIDFTTGKKFLKSIKGFPSMTDNKGEDGNTVWFFEANIDKRTKIIG
ncbi:MAG: hypothetical protein GXO90_04275 [FCB group bacterium]|nr:hypothetical protein [FCB group bacterium]